MTVTNRKIDGKIKYFDITPSGFYIEIDKSEYDTKLDAQIKDFKVAQKKSKGGRITKKPKTKPKRSGHLAKRGYGISR
jgi:hypothetical protein